MKQTKCELKLIQQRREEREDKICGVCYDCQATCKVDCSHKVCQHCYTKMDSCPFCRKTYRFKYDDLDILLDKEIDIDAPRNITMDNKNTLCTGSA